MTPPSSQRQGKVPLDGMPAPITAPQPTMRPDRASPPPPPRVPSRAALAAAADPGRGLAWLRAACLALSLATFVCLLLPTAAHVRDRYRIDHVSGVWLVLADAAKDGVLYPPLHDEAAGGRLGGTRYMPLGIMATGGLARLTGDVILAGKIVSLAGSLALATAMLLICRWLRSPLSISLGLVAVLLATEPGQIALLTARQEAWPAALQLLGVCIVMRDRRAGAVVLAACVCVIAFLIKLSAVWAPVAIGLWLLVKNRRAWVIYCGTYWVVAAAVLGLLHWWTQGRMADSLLGLGGAGLGAAGGTGLGGIVASALESVGRLAKAAAVDAPVILALAGAAVAALALGIGRDRSVGLLGVAFAAAALLLVVLFADVGVASNHLIDIGAVSACLAGALTAGQGSTVNDSTTVADASDTASGLGGHAVVGGIVAVSLVLAIPAYLLRPAVSSAKLVAKGGTDEWSSRTPLAGRFHPGSKVLFEDPSLWLAIGQKPEFSDPFMLPRLFRKHPQWAQPFVDRIANREYEAIVLIRPIHAEFDHYKDIHLGEAIGRTILEHYEFKRLETGRWIYTPKAPASAPSHEMTPTPAG